MREGRDETRDRFDWIACFGRGCCVCCVLCVVCMCALFLSFAGRSRSRRWWVPFLPSRQSIDRSITQQPQQQQPPLSTTSTSTSTTSTGLPGPDEGRRQDRVHQGGQGGGEPRQRLQEVKRSRRRRGAHPLSIQKHQQQQQHSPKNNTTITKTTILIPAPNFEPQQQRPTTTTDRMWMRERPEREGNQQTVGVCV